MQIPPATSPATSGSHSSALFAFAGGSSVGVSDGDGDGVRGLGGDVDVLAVDEGKVDIPDSVEVDLIEDTVWLERVFTLVVIQSGARSEEE